MKMIKCKLAQLDGNCPKKKEICCHKCEDFGTCSSACGEEDPGKCEDAVFEGSTEMEVFQSKASTVIKAIADIATQKKALEDQDKIMREQLEKVMGECGIKSFENDLVKITYVEPTTRESIDSAKLKKELPDVAAKYTKTSNVKGSVRISVK